METFRGPRHPVLAGLLDGRARLLREQVCKLQTLVRRWLGPLGGMTTVVRFRTLLTLGVCFFLAGKVRARQCHQSPFRQDLGAN